MPEALAAGTAATAPLLDVVEVSKSFRGLKAVSRASLAVSQGKGLTLEAAKASGVMEAVELYHAERIELPELARSLVEL